MKNDPDGSVAAPVDLARLGQVELDAEIKARLTQTLKSCSGPAYWRHRKAREAGDLLALAQVAPHRLAVLHLDLDTDFQADLLMNVPVACRPDNTGDIRLARSAWLRLHYPENAIRLPLPGAQFVQIIQPREVFLANVFNDPAQPLCLGASLPAGTRVREIVLMAYGALSLQSVMIDEQDAVGVAHVEAARWWQQNRHRIPLSRTPFLCPDAEEDNPRPKT